LFPKWIEGYHLTLMTILWSAGLIVFGWLAVRDLNWLWLSSLMLFLQWFTDSFDGALGRLRDSGIPKWGFFMDHLLDFVFAAAIFIGYTFLFCGFTKELFYLFVPVYGCLMVSSFLAFGASGEFKITYLGTGPTEFRLFFILLNCAIIKFGTGFIEKSLLYVFIGFVCATCFVIYRSQKYIWSIDMADKGNE
jgi:archaetidylinositol phosphate synthase